MRISRISTENPRSARHSWTCCPPACAGFHELDPVPYDDLRPGQVHAMAESITPWNARHERYWRDFLIPGQRQFQRIMRVTTPGGYNAFLVIWRGTHDFTAADSAVLAALGPHLAISLRIYAELERERVRAGISGEAVRRRILAGCGLMRAAMCWTAIARLTPCCAIVPRCASAPTGA